MKKFGLIGKPLAHSFSRSFFLQYFEKENIEAGYDNIELDNISCFADIKKQKEYSGFSVTNPYKELIIPYLDDLDDTAQMIGAVNCINVEKGRYIGYNTDCYGFTKAILPHIQLNHTKALVLGSGGASKAVCYALQKMNIAVTIVSRQKVEGRITYEELTADIFDTHLVVVNATPVGMFPNVDDSPPISYQYASEKHLFFDLIYNPKNTLFLQKSKENGALVLNGYEMLVNQALRAIEIFNI
ncbi:MAG: shikimate dehydrogenase [Bacteroidales bacterium]|nr:MAG: shikimate dehydrogenase [Bacteroidales bacterium]